MQKSQRKLVNLHLFCSIKYVMAIGRRRTREGAAYHSTIGNEHGERRMPIDKQRDYAVEDQDRRAEKEIGYVQP